jgi:hypothetical protein
MLGRREGGGSPEFDRGDRSERSSSASVAKAAPQPAGGIADFEDDIPF